MASLQQNQLVMRLSKNTKSHDEYQLPLKHPNLGHFLRLQLSKGNNSAANKSCCTKLSDLSHNYLKPTHSTKVRQSLQQQRALLPLQKYMYQQECLKQGRILPVSEHLN